MANTAMQNRAQMIKKALSDVEIVTFKEATVLTLRWARYEYLILKRNRIQRRIDRHERFLKHQMDLFNMRHQLKDNWTAPTTTTKE